MSSPPLKRTSSSSATTAKATKPSARKWSRVNEDLDPAAQLGPKLRALRLERNWSLSEAAVRTGVAAGTWSRIENNKMAPTYAVLLRLMENLGIDWNQLMPVAKAAPTARPSFSAAKKASSVQLKTARRVHPHGHSADGPLHPAIVEISADRPDEFELFAHDGMEFCYVLEGKLRFHAKGTKARDLGVGESVLFDSRTPHAYTPSDNKPVKLLIVLTSMRHGST